MKAVFRQGFFPVVLLTPAYVPFAVLFPKVDPLVIGKGLTTTVLTATFELTAVVVAAASVSPPDAPEAEVAAASVSPPDAPEASANDPAVTVAV